MVPHQPGESNVSASSNQYAEARRVAPPTSKDACPDADRK